MLTTILQLSGPEQMPPWVLVESETHRTEDGSMRKTGSSEMMVFVQFQR